jgi:hypothetical protein
MPLRAWIQAAGTLKRAFERVEYDPATHRFDTKLNIGHGTHQIPDGQDADKRTG